MHFDSIPTAVAAVGVTLVAAIVVKHALEKLHVPAAVGYIVLGALLSLANERWAWKTPFLAEVFRFLGAVGVACLLFRVGLHCNLRALLAQLGRAVRAWLGDFIISGVVGFSVARFWLGLPLPTAAVIAVALTATSVGVSVVAWQERRVLDSPDGQLMLDIAELDDLSGVLAMSVLFAVLPALQGHATNGVRLVPLLVAFVPKLAAFGAICWAYAEFVEQRLTGLLRRARQPTDPLLLILATSLLIAAVAEWLGLSLAIGAFFAGLMYSRDPQHVRLEASFDTIYGLFTPFFFVAVGLGVVWSAIVPALTTGAALLLAAVAGKMLGNGLPVASMRGMRSGVLIGFSMIPRAEIAMVIVQRARDVDPRLVPDTVFGAMVLVSLVTCIAAPLIVSALLERWPPEQAAGEDGSAPGL